MQNFKNESEVEELYKTTKRKVIIFEGAVYDVGSYISQHPGGSDKIEEYLGKCIDEPFEEASHTKSARLIFRDLDRIGFISG
jgi:cytochrome b involved in lipid metabolism